MYRGSGHAIGSPSTLRILDDQMVWPHPLNVMQYARSSYFYNYVYVLSWKSLNAANEKNVLSEQNIHLF